MTKIDLDGDDAADGLMTLVLAVIEILTDALEREAVRRMESGDLSDEEVERLGAQLASVEEEIDRLEAEAEVSEPVDNLRGELDGLVTDLVHRANESDRAERGVIGNE